MGESLGAGYLLDRRWYWMREEMERSKEPDLVLLVEILSRERVPHALIGGVALQIHLREPRTTLDVHSAVESRDRLPEAALSRAVEVRVGTTALRVLAAADLLHEKLRAGRDPARRRSKRLQDLADAQALLEQDPGLARGLDPDERALLDGLPR